MKKVRVILSPEAEEVFNFLNKEEASSKTEERILKGIKKKVELIKNNPHYGEPISKKKIPNEYVQKYGVSTSFGLNYHFFGECCIH